MRIVATQPLRRWTRCATVAVLAATACSDDSPPPNVQIIRPPTLDTGVVAIYDGGVAAPDGGVPDTGEAPRPPDTVRISGRTLRLDAFLAGIEEPVREATIRTIGTVGVAPVGSSEATGSYEIDVPQDGQLILAASAQTGYLESYEALIVGAADVPDRDFYLAYRPHVDRLNAAFGVDFSQPFACHPPNQGQCVYALVIGQVVDDGSAAGGPPTPLAEVAAEDFTLRGEGDPDWYVKGPYFFLFNGQPNANGTETERQPDGRGGYVGGLFAYYVEIPQVGPASRTFEVSASSYAGGPQRRYFGPKAFTAFRGGFTWVELAETGIPVEPPEPPPVTDVDFATQVYPLFLPVAQGGYGCQGCHTNQGGQAPAGGLNLYGDPATAYQGLNPNQYEARVNVQNPGESLLLTKPLYEADGVQNHPIFAFLSELDPAYRTVYGWIAEGGIYEGNIPPPVPVSFYNEVRPILYQNNANGGAGCDGCHVNGVNAGNAPGGAYFGGDGNALWQVLTQQPPTDNGQTGEAYRINRNGETARSLLLLNPLVGSPEPHPAKLFNGANDPRYLTIYRWIEEGYINDTP